MDDKALIAHLTAERDKAREDAGVYKYRMENYNREMYIYLRKSVALKKELDAIKDINAG